MNENIWKRPIDSNDALTRKLLNQPDDIHGPQIHYIFGRTLDEVAKILDEHEAKSAPDGIRHNRKEPQ